MRNLVDIVRELATTKTKVEELERRFDDFEEKNEKRIHRFDSFIPPIVQTIVSAILGWFIGHHIK